MYNKTVIFYAFMPLKSRGIFVTIKNVNKSFFFFFRNCEFSGYICF